jgi:ribosomal protein S18 acetylase RimI-like enzyme
LTKSNLEFRIATLDDIESIVDLWWESARFHAEIEPRFRYASDAVESTKAYYSKQIPLDTFIVVLAEEGEDIVGFAGAQVISTPPIHLHQKIGHIDSLFVKPRVRRTSIGTHLWDICRDWLIQKEVAKVKLTVASMNPGAHAFWRKIGFRDLMIQMELDP